jgi:uncharacterized protein (DUF2235 family)
MSQPDDGTGNGSSESEHEPKVIAVFSDGTGNSAAKVLRTNVWRLYQALDTSEPTPGTKAQGARRQITYYDDGVGTSSFRPLALLGGAFGWGLKRNVLDLYTFLCRNYKEGDEIYAFGFSRGAFTIRILAGLLTKEGLLSCAPGCTEEELARNAPDAYRAYRRDLTQRSRKGRFKLWVLHVFLLRMVRDTAIRAWRRFWHQKTYDEIEKKEMPNDAIAFVGVWDTVAAYGTPFAELTHGIDNWVWPLSMPDRKLSKKVKKACHALALDDERDTFHPLLWSEIEEQELIDKKEVSEGRLKQVWFAGMHSDVGGGYAEDGLAHVALEWMMQEAAAAGTVGLRYDRDKTDHLARECNPLGPLHDSRRGLGGYYRYQPRRISALLEPPDPATRIMRNPDLKGHGLLREVKIHQSVIDRIRSGPDHYSPIVLPAAYQVVDRHGKSAPSPESTAAAQARVIGQEAVWNEVWKKRVFYFLTVGASLVLAALPLIHAIWPPSACVGPQCLLTPVIAGVGDFLPGFVAPWITAFAHSPGLSLGLAIGIAVLLAMGAKWQRHVQDQMRRLWEESLQLSRTAEAPRESGRWLSRLISWLRTNEGYQAVLWRLKWKVGPNIFGFGTFAVTLVLIVLLPLLAIYRVQLAAAERSNAICELDGGAQAPAPEGFSTKSLCWATGSQVEAGRHYRVTLTVNQPWVDGTIATDPVGFGSEQLPWYARYTAAPLRRSLSERWFQPLVKIVPPAGNGSSHVEAVDLKANSAGGYSAEFAAARTGEVFLFVNDAIVSWRGLTQDFYSNNEGVALVQIEPVGGDVREAAATGSAGYAD